MRRRTAVGMVAGGVVAALVAVPACGGPGNEPRGADARARDRSATTVPAPPPATAPPAVVTSPPVPATTPAFTARADAVTASDLGASWHAGCPVGPEDLRRLSVTYWDFDGQVRTGALVVHADVADAVIGVFGRLFEQRFPIRRMETIDRYDGSDDASLAADNTSAFNCRLAVATGPPQWSAHSFGTAIDVNPVENPYVLGRDVLPPAGAAYVDRTNVRPGMAVPGGPMVEAFAAAGWQWGGRWTGSPDYQHFSASGG